MKKLFTLVFLFSFLISFGQDTVRIVHQNYTTVYSKSLHYPVIVTWWETTARNNCAHIARLNQFQKDPLLPLDTDMGNDYVKSGTDRGHMCPAASNECQGSQILKECFYFSNMAPQYHNLNAGDWEKIEKSTRQLAIQHDSIQVWAGSIGVVKKFNRLSIPAQCWKVIHIKKTGEWFGFLFNNTNDNTKNRTQEQTVEQIEKLTGFKFKK